LDREELIFNHQTEAGPDEGFSEFERAAVVAVVTAHRDSLKAENYESLNE
jgi:hypothetical protein